MQASIRTGNTIIEVASESRESCLLRVRGEESAHVFALDASSARVLATALLEEAARMDRLAAKS